MSDIQKLLDAAKEVEIQNIVQLPTRREQLEKSIYAVFEDMAYAMRIEKLVSMTLANKELRFFFNGNSFEELTKEQLDIIKIYNEEILGTKYSTESPVALAMAGCGKNALTDLFNELSSGGYQWFWDAGWRYETDKNSYGITPYKMQYESIYIRKVR